MNDARRLITSIIVNATIVPWIMAMAAQATGGDLEASLVGAITVFWPALLASAGLQGETTAHDWRERTARLGIPLIVVEIALLPLLVIAILWLNPGLALLVQNTKGWVIGAAVAGGANRLANSLAEPAWKSLGGEAERPTVSARGVVRAGAGAAPTMETPAT